MTEPKVMLHHCRGTRLLTFVRHGATSPNLAGLRCGGDLDVPLVDAGRRQAAEVAARLRAGTPVASIVTSPLKRTRETAEIIGRELGGVAVRIEPAFAERRLGAWNLRPIVETESLLASGATPPGGEADEAFVRRIAQAVEAWLPHLLCEPTLLVGSKGVARALRVLFGVRARAEIANGEILNFDLSAYAGARDECPT